MSWGWLPPEVSTKQTKQGENSKHENAEDALKFQNLEGEVGPGEVKGRMKECLTAFLQRGGFQVGKRLRVLGGSKFGGQSRKWRGKNRDLPEGNLGCSDFSASPSRVRR